MSHDRPHRLIVEPGSRRIEVDAGTSLSEALRIGAVAFAYPCGGAQLCGRCRVRFESGAPAPTPDERRILPYEEIEKGVRLACCCVVEGDAVVRVEAVGAYRTELILDRGVRSDVVIDPEVKRYCCALLPSTLEAPLADWSRVVAGLPDDARPEAEPTLGVLQDLRAVVSRAEKAGEPVTLTMRGRRAIDVVCGDRTGEHAGVAVDVGTTTLVAALVDMRTGEEIATAACLNPQRDWGLDLISRIHAVQTDAANLRRLHDAVVRAVGGLIGRVCAERGLAPESVCAMTVAGNTLMSHLFLGLDPTGLGHAPFAGTLRAGVRLEARDLALPIHPRAPVYVLPCIGGFVGGDFVAGMLLTQIQSLPGVSVLVDIGTNGEVAVACEGRLYATSSAAGPAFEGGKIACGTMAADGAIDAVSLDGADFGFHTIGEVPARGICGSGLIEFFARAVEVGLIESNGRIARRSDPPVRSLSPALTERLREDDGGQPRIVLAPNRAGQSEIYVSQADVREFQLGKGAIQAAIRMVLAETGIEVERIDRFLVAGAFGNRVSIDAAMRLGLVPAMPREKVAFIGNSSLEGARCVLLNRYEGARAERIAGDTRLVELASRPEFQECFAESMTLG